MSFWPSTTGYLMSEEIAGLPKIDHAVNAALVTAWAAVIGGDLIGIVRLRLRSPARLPAPAGRTQRIRAPAPRDGSASIPQY